MFLLLKFDDSPAYQQCPFHLSETVPALVGETLLSRPPLQGVSFIKAAEQRASVNQSKAVDCINIKSKFTERKCKLRWAPNPVDIIDTTEVQASYDRSSAFNARSPLERLHPINITFEHIK